MIGSIPGILIGSQLTVALPEKALRGSLASVLALSSLKMLGAVLTRPVSAPTCFPH